MVVNDADSPPDLHLLDTFNFGAAETSPIASLHWAATDPTWSPPDLPLEVGDLAAADKAAAAAAVDGPDEQDKGKDKDKVKEAAKRNNSRDVQKLKKRRAAFDKAREARDEFLAGGFDGCVPSLPSLSLSLLVGDKLTRRATARRVIIAAEYEPYSVIERLLPRIGGSASVVVYSPHLPVRPSLLRPLLPLPFYSSLTRASSPCSSSSQSSSASASTRPSSRRRSTSRSCGSTRSCPGGRTQRCRAWRAAGTC